MALLETVVRKRQLPDYTMYMEVTTTGMHVTCCVYEDRGSYRRLREIFETNKSKHRWFDTVELFFKLACEHYPARTDLGLVKNVNKGGSF
jgi:hypothetical protein